MSKFTNKDLKLFTRLNTPAKIQDFLNSIPINFESDGHDTIKSPAMVMRAGNAHCFEGALLGAYILSLHGYRSLLMNLSAADPDFDHVIAPFKQNGLWGALSKTNHAVLRYREPVYKTIRELAMSYFHEYFTDNGIKTLRCYSQPLNLNIFEADWATSDIDLWGIDEALDKVKYYDIAPRKVLKKLRRADVLERQAGKLVEWGRRNKRVGK